MRACGPSAGSAALQSGASARSRGPTSWSTAQVCVKATYLQRDNAPMLCCLRSEDSWRLAPASHSLSLLSLSRSPSPLYHFPSSLSSLSLSLFQLTFSKPLSPSLSLSPSLPLACIWEGGPAGMGRAGSHADSSSARTAASVTDSSSACREEGGAGARADKTSLYTLSCFTDRSMRALRVCVSGGTGEGGSAGMGCQMCVRFLRGNGEMCVRILRGRREMCVRFVPRAGRAKGRHLQ